MIKEIGDVNDMFENISEKNCLCGKEHIFASKVIIEKGAINKLPFILEEMNLKSAFIIADKNTYSAAGEKVIDVLERSGIKTKIYIFSKEILEPDETNVGLAVMNYYPASDIVIGVGSGVINDIGKIVANVTEKPYIIVATAPSMDGYASGTSSMTVEGLKISLNSKCADVIIGDTDILCKAPLKMMLAGLGDMIAKYVSICEWRISNLINGEYFCEDIADLVRASLKKCVDNAEGLRNREEDAVKAVFEGLVLCGVAMKFAGLSRPASGVEHYLSHVWDMRNAEFGTPVELHGIQCAVGTLIAIKLYEKIRNISPDKQKALAYVKNFDYCAWSEELRSFLGKGAESMIALEEKEHKYDIEKHKARLQVIVDNWDNIIQILNEELPSYGYIKKLFEQLGIPTTMKENGLDEKILPMTFKASKDIRDKYVLSRLCWDLGICDEVL